MKIVSRSWAKVRMTTRVHPAFEVAGHVVQRLAVGVHHVGGDVHDVAAQLAHANREGDPGPQRRLLEQQRRHAGRQASSMRWARLLRASRSLAAMAEALPQLLGREVENREEVIAPP